MRPEFAVIVQTAELSLSALHRSRQSLEVADAIAFMQKRKLGEMPSFVNDWRAGGNTNYSFNRTGAKYSWR